MLFENIKLRTIRFSGVITLIITLWGYSIAAAIYLKDPLFIIRVGLITTLYLIFALYTQDISVYADFLREVYDTTQTTMSTEEKLIHIKNICELEVDKWLKYWYMYQRIVKGKKIIWDITPQLKEVGERIIKGEITIGQGIWIFGYLTYSALIGANVFEINMPLDLVAIFGFLMGVLFASGSVIGLTKFMSILFHNIKPETETTVQKRLTTIEKEIQRISKKYFFIKIKTDYAKASKPAISK